MRCTLALMLLGLCMAAGCQTSSSTPPSNRFWIQASSYEPLYEASRQVLRERGFTLNQQNYRFGLITTEPTTAATLFEPFRANHATSRSAMRSTLRHTRRTVTVALEPADDIETVLEAQTAGEEDAPPTRPGEVAVEPPTVATTQPANREYQIRVWVTVEAKQKPTRRLVGGGGERIFSSLDRVPERWQQRGIEGTYWQPIGRDRELEHKLLRAILRRAFTDKPGPARATETTESATTQGSGRPNARTQPDR
jgi:hypothetical protein